MDLKIRLKEMETSTEESLRELRSKYEQQMDNISKLRQLYEERADAVARGHQSEMDREKARYTLLELKMADTINQTSEVSELKTKLAELEESVKNKEEESDRQKELHKCTISECKNLTAQLTLINNLFSNMLTGNELDFDLLTQLLQDNHNLITDLIANGDINETAALLFDIVEKVYKKSEESSTTSDGETSTAVQPVSASAKEAIASNLPKVWRVLIELMSRHIDCGNIVVVQGVSEECCYKDVQTPHGSRSVISVSQTYLRLKDLIVEKNCLVKEVTRLKTLNGHLENRLDLQEKRLSTVCSELKKTWGVVSKLKVQHRQLHTNEKVLRYELRHKRQMLNNLKDDLQYCRDTWDLVKEKNTQTEHDWEVLRKEFALRKNRNDVSSNSAESGYDDDHSPDISTSDSDYDVSSSDRQKHSLEENEEGTVVVGSSHQLVAAVEFEDAASDATVIELADILDLDNGNTEDVDDCILTQAADEMDVERDAQLPDNDGIVIVEDSAMNNSEDDISRNNHCRRYDVVPTEEASSSVDLRNSEESPSYLTIPPRTSAEDSTQSSEELTQQKIAEDKWKARSERLKRLENQCRSLLNQMSLTSLRSDTLSLRLEELHEQYGSTRRRNESSSGEENLPETTTNVEGENFINTTVEAEVPSTANDNKSDIAEESTPSFSGGSSGSSSSSSDNGSVDVEEPTAGPGPLPRHQESSETVDNDEEEEEEITSRTRETRLDRVQRIEEEYLQIFHQPAISPEALEQIRNSNNSYDSVVPSTSRGQTDTEE